jgi:UDP-3-O-[3-hydroxymyristoyl] N-acetylglucosamine deacetylase / 3-hydroxyacyl-[acyl-carrier-protein] dehydratase
VAVRPSHSLNCELTRAIHAQMIKPLLAMQAFTPPPIAAGEKTSSAAAEEKAILEAVSSGSALDNTQVMKILPHRFPFLMVDKVLKIEGSKIVGIKNVSINEPYFQGHFPQRPIMPGVLQLEAIAQVAGILMLRQAENYGKIAFFMSAENVKWRKPVVPGDTIRIEVEMTKVRGKIGKAKGICYVENDPVSEADVTFMLVDPEK